MTYKSFIRHLRSVSLFATVAALAACTALDKTPDGDGTSAAPAVLRRAAVVADEPSAMQAGSAILNEGGNAADAATAMYFTLAVTYPVAAGIGGGGICLIRDAQANRVSEYDFPVASPHSTGAFGLGANVGGFAALQAAFGKLAWRRDIVPAEKLAGLGYPISDVLEARLISSEKAIHLDASLAGEFLDESGRLKPAGSVIVLPQLAETLARIRTSGANGFVRGLVGARILQYLRTQGETIEKSDLDQNRVTARQPGKLKVAPGVIWIPDPLNGASTALSRALESATAAVVTGAGSALDSGAIDDGSTTFAAVDPSGEAVACAVSMNGAFGSGHTVPGTGVTLARAPVSGANALSLLAPILAADEAGNVRLIGGASGSDEAENALANIVMRSGEARVESAGARFPGSLNAIHCVDDGCKIVEHTE